MDVVAPVAMVVPLTTALVLLVLVPLSRRRLVDVVAFAAALATVALTAVLLVRSGDHLVLHWFAGWLPRRGFPVGIDFAVDRIGAGLALLAALLTTAALATSWRYFDDVTPLYSVLVLVFLGAMVAFSYTGDLFNLFVFFELMSVPAYALAGYKVEEEGALQGALNFAVTNSVGAFCTLTGIAFLYGRTGTLSLAAIGRSLAGHHPDGLVIVAFVLVTTGFLVKAAVVPFHFWLADAHAVAPTPICVLFSGVMVGLGVYGVTRVYWTVFSDTITPPHLRGLLVAVGVVTAVIGAVMCLGQHHLKRLLAFSTISHTGIAIAGIGLLDRTSLAGAGIYVLGHGLVKASLFVVTAILVTRLGAFDERRLHGRGRDMRWTAAVWFIGCLGLAGLPPFATSPAHGLIDEGLDHHGWPWLATVLAGSAAATAASAFRAGGHVFLGWGRVEDDQPASAEGEEEQPEVAKDRPTAPVMFAVAALLLMGGLALGLAPRLGHHADVAAGHFVNRPAMAAAVLDGAPLPEPPPMPAAPTGSAERAGVATAAVALLAGGFALSPRRPTAEQLG